MLEPASGGSPTPTPAGPPSGGPHLRPRALWIAFALFALGLPLLVWLLRAL